MSFTIDPILAEHIVVPLMDRVLVEVEEQSEQKFGSLIVPGTAQDKPIWGTVRGVGPDAQVRDGDLVQGDEPWILKIGDRVLYARYGGHDIELQGGRKFLLLAESDVLAKLVKPEAAHG